MNISQSIRSLIEKNLSNFESEGHISDDDNIFAMGFVNSLFAMKIVEFIENKYNIELVDDDLDINNFCSINRIKAFILEKQTDNLN